MTDAPIRKLAASLGCEIEALLVGANDAAANDGGGRDEVYSDDGPVMAAEHSAGAPSAREPVDMAAVFEQALEQLVATSDDRYTEDDAELVVSLLSMGDLPPSLTPREVPGLLTAWLEPASELRRLGRAEPGLVLALVRDEGPKGAAKMARGIIAKIERAKAPAKGAPKKPAKG